MKRILPALLLLIPCAASAHVVPDDVKVQAFLKPQGNRLTVLVRMPANALIDILFPVLPGTGSLDLKQIDGYANAGAQVWIADLLSVDEDGRPLPPPRILETRISPLSDLSFTEFESALKHTQGDRLPPDTLLSQDEATIDALLEIPIHSAASAFSFEPRFARLGVRVRTTLAFLPATGGVRQYTYEGDPEPFPLNPSWNQAAARFIKAGFGNVIAATDDLLFLFCVSLVCRRTRSLTAFFAAFAAAQTCGIVCCAAGWAVVVPQLTVTLAAAAVVYMAIEIIAGASKSDRSRLPVAITCGLVFGFSFWQQLDPIVQYAGTHRLISPAAFNFGLVAAQTAILAAFAAALPPALRITKSPRTAVVIAAALAIRISWHRMIDGAHALAVITTNAPLTINAAILLVACGAGAFACPRLFRRSTNTGWSR